MNLIRSVVQGKERRRPKVSTLLQKHDKII